MAEKETLAKELDRKRASPTESAVRLDQADREHSGAGILNQGKARCGRQRPSAQVRHPSSRDTRMASVICQEWSAGLCNGPLISMRVVPRSMD